MLTTSPQTPTLIPPQLWTPLGVTPSILMHHVPYPLQPDGACGTELREYLSTQRVWAQLQYLADADSGSSPAINLPPYPHMRLTSTSGGHSSSLQMCPCPHEAERMRTTHGRDHASNGTFRVLFP